MDQNELFYMLRRAPFRPFQIRMSDGTFYEVHHPELVLQGTVSTYVRLRPSDDPVRLDNQSITQLVPLAAVAAE